MSRPRDDEGEFPREGPQIGCKRLLSILMAAELYPRLDDFLCNSNGLLKNAEHDKLLIDLRTIFGLT